MSDITEMLDPMQQHLVKIVISLAEDQWGVGSGFIVRLKNRQYLVTAFHNLSGGISCEARFKHNIPPRSSNIELYYYDKFIFSFSPYKAGKSLFTVHPSPVACDFCDIAILDICTMLGTKSTSPLSNNVIGLPIESVSLPHPFSPHHHLVDNMFLTTGSNVLIYGFPGGRDYYGAPIGVGSKIAAYSPTARQILLSGYTTTGCSGGMVIARKTNDTSQLESTLKDGTQSPPLILDQLLGIYAGRLEGLEAESSQIARTHIGIIWNVQTILESITAGRSDTT